MANDARTIQGTVNTVNDDSRHRVALDLAVKVSYSEPSAQKDRNYWLNLYAECWQVVTYGRRE